MTDIALLGEENLMAWAIAWTVGRVLDLCESFANVYHTFTVGKVDDSWFEQFAKAALCDRSERTMSAFLCLAAQWSVVLTVLCLKVSWTGLVLLLLFGQKSIMAVELPCEANLPVLRYPEQFSFLITNSWKCLYWMVLLYYCVDMSVDLEVIILFHQIRGLATGEFLALLL